MYNYHRHNIPIWETLNRDRETLDLQYEIISIEHEITSKYNNELIGSITNNKKDGLAAILFGIFASQGNANISILDGIFDTTINNQQVKQKPKQVDKITLDDIEI